MITSKYSPTPMLAVDVDGTLIINGVGNTALIDYLREKKTSGTKMMLWSARGKDYAIATAKHLGVAELFGDIVSKPGYIIDDQGWEWIKYTEIVSPFSDRPKLVYRRG